MELRSDLMKGEIYLKTEKAPKMTSKDFDDVTRSYNFSLRKMIISDKSWEAVIG